MKKIWKISKFYGGLSEGDKVGLEGSFKSGYGLDYRSNPDKLTVNKKTVWEAGSSLCTSYPTWIVPSGGIGASNPTVDIYMTTYRPGMLFKKRQGGTAFESVCSISGYGLGLAYYPVDDQLYVADTQGLKRYGPLGGTVSINKDFQSLSEYDNVAHPMKTFLHYLCVGNGRYLATWDGTTWKGSRLDTVRGWKIRTLEVFEDYLAIGCWKGTTISDSDKGIIFYWDGTSTTWNFFTEVPGGVNALLKSGGELLAWIGPNAELYSIPYPGAEPIKVRDIPNIEAGGTAEILPGATANWQGIPYFGFPGGGTATTPDKGVYSWGTRSRAFAQSLNLDFPISQGAVSGPTTYITSLSAVGPSRFFVGWWQAGNYGIDAISTTAPYANAEFQSLIFDGEEPFRKKRATLVKGTCTSLKTGQVIVISYKADRASSWTEIGRISTVGETIGVFETSPLPFDFHELQLKVEFTATSTAPELTSLIVVYEPEETYKK